MRFALGLLGFALSAAAQCSSAPASFSSLCTQLQSELDSFNATLNAQWNGVKPNLAFSSDLTTADANRGIQTLLAPTTLTGVQNQLDAFASLGLNCVTFAASFPILYQPFYQYNSDPQDYPRVLAFYQSVMSEVRKRGMKVVVENSVLFPSVATDLPLTAYYATLSAAQVTAGRAQGAQIIAQQLQPDWINLGSEPDTQSALLGLSTEYTPQQWAAEIGTIVSTLRNAGVAAKPLIGAGIGDWQASGAAYLSALLPVGLDFIDFHIYPINLGFLPGIVAYMDMAHAAGKPIALSEAWLKKVGDSQLQGQSDFGIIKTISSDTVNSYDTFSFWASLDTEFIQEIVNLGYWKNLYYVSPFSGNYFFAYLDYAQVGSLSAEQILTQETTAASAAMRAGAVTATGSAYRGFTQQPPGPAVTSAASGVNPIASGSIVSVYTAGASLSTSPGDVSIGLVDAEGTSFPLQIFSISPHQINAAVPDAAASGQATLTVATPGGSSSSSTLIVPVAPGIFAANGNGMGAAAAQLVVTHADGSQTVSLIYQCPGGAGSCIAVPVSLGSAAADQATLVLYGTGVHNRARLADVTLSIVAPTSSQALPVVCAGPVSGFTGLDQVNVPLPRGLAGAGPVTVAVSIAGTFSNFLSLNIAP